MKNNLLIISLTVLVLAITFFLTLDLHQISEQEVVSQFNEYQLLHAQTLAAQVKAHLSAREQELRVLSTFESIRNFNLPIVERNLQEMLNFIRSKGVESISLYDSNGVIVASTNRKAVGRVYKEASCFQWAQKPKNKSKTHLAGPIHPYDTLFDTSGKKKFSLNQQPYRFQLILPLYHEELDKRNRRTISRFLGMVTHTLNIAELLTHDPSTQVLQTNHELWIIDTSGTLLYQSKHPEMVTRNIKQRPEECNGCHLTFDYVDDMLRQREGTSLYQLKDQPKKLAAYTRMEDANTSWIFVLNIPYDRITTFIGRHLQQTILILGIVIVALIGSSTLLYRNYRLKVRAEEEAKQWREKRALEEKIQKSEERYRTIIETAHDIIWTLDTNGNFTFFNKRGEEISGYKLSDWLGKSFVPLIHPDDLPNVKDVFLKTLSGKPQTYEVRVFNSAGNMFILSVNTIPMFEDNRIVGTVSFGRDITEQKQAEAEILKRNRRLAVLYAIDRASAQSLDIEEILIDSADATREALGIEAVMIFLLEPDGETMTLRIYRGVSDEFVRAVQHIRLGEGISGKAVAERKPIVLDVSEYPTERLAPFILKEGFQTLASTPLISGGELVGAMNLGTRRSYAFPPEDMELLESIGQQLGTAIRNAQLYEKLQQELVVRRRTEEEIKERKTYLETIMDSTLDLMFTVTSDGKFSYANRRLKDILGYSFEEIQHKHFLDFIPKELHSFMQKKWMEIQQGISGVYETQVIRADGSIIDCLVSHLPLKGLNEYLAILKDITERKQTEEALRKQEERHKKVIENIFRFIPEGVLVFNDKLKLFNQNKTFDDIVRTYSTKLGYIEQELKEIIIEEAKKRLMGEKSATIKIKKKTVKI